MGESVEYPIDNTFLEDKASIIEEFRELFKIIRVKRNDKGRCLFCGGLQYVEIGNPDPGIRHDDCGGEFVRLYSIHSANYMISAYRVYSVDGLLIGRLKEHRESEGMMVVNECVRDASA